MEGSGWKTQVSTLTDSDHKKKKTLRNLMYILRTNLKFILLLCENPKIMKETTGDVTMSLPPSHIDSAMATKRLLYSLLCLSVIYFMSSGKVF